MNKGEMKRLGDYIREVDVRNRNLEVTKLMVINIGKYFMPSVANVIGTDLSNYKIVGKGQFACNLMHVGRDEKIPIALLDTNERIIVSPAYWVFEVSNTTQLLPDYLMLWFRRNEFDRNAWFYTDSDVRGGMSKEALMDMTLPIPPIEQQQKIVAEYEAITRRIRLNEQINVKLEETAQALYRKMFVDGIDKENLPEGWRMGTLGEIAEITMGQSPDGESYNMKGNGIIFYQGRSDFGKRFPTIRMYTTRPTKYANKKDILLSVRAPVGDLNVTLYDCCIGRGLAALRSIDNCQSYLFYQMLNLSDTFNKSNDDGTIFGSINKDDLFGLKVIIPSTRSIMIFERKAFSMDRMIELKNKEIRELIELQSLLLAKMGQ